MEAVLILFVVLAIAAILWGLSERAKRKRLEGKLDALSRPSSTPLPARDDRDHPIP